MLYSLLALLLCANSIFSHQFTQEKTAQGTRITATIDADEQHYLYKEFIDVQSSSPDLRIGQWHIQDEPIQHYDTSFKAEKKIYTKPISIVIDTFQTNQGNDHQAIHIRYLQSNTSGPESFVIPLDAQRTPAAESSSLVEQPQDSIPNSSFTSTHDQEQTQSWSEYIGALIANTHSIWLQLLLVLLLGMMLSLTPCIYPMIPITVGVLQSRGSKSFLSNFLLSLLYTCGMATTYALFGLLASCVGPICGQLLVQPLFVLALIALLAYFALSMIGLFDMYIPRFMQQQQQLKGGSLLSIFLFGAASGSIASPCVSPGLALVLTAVATLGNQLLGFILLFAFGVGLSFPLLLIGTFSSSINMLPRAGMWMVEMKRLFGILMLGMCFYYASYVISLHTLLWIMALTALGLGLFYIATGLKNFSPFWRKINKILGLLLIAISVVIAFYAYKESFRPQTYSLDDFWQSDYAHARQMAITQNKKLFIDFWATFCPVCIAINKKVLPDIRVKNALSNFVNLKVDGTYASNDPYASIKDIYDVHGFPVYIVVDPVTQKVIARFGSEIYDMDKKQLAKLLEQHA